MRNLGYDLTVAIVKLYYCLPTVVAFAHKRMLNYAAFSRDRMRAKRADDDVIGLTLNCTTAYT